MPVLLRRSDDLPEASAYDIWVSVSGDAPRGVSGSPLSDVPSRLETMFDGVAAEWQAVAKSIAGDPTSGLAHMPGAAPTCSDFGLMLAWSKLADDLAKGNERVLLVCDDPWLFRHLAGRENVAPGRLPGLAVMRLKLSVRGLLARTKAALKVAFASLAFRHHRVRLKGDAPVILAYAHVYSRASGYDGYFGDLMDGTPDMVRLLHTDGSLSLARALSADVRTMSLHAWGDPFAALSLPLARWKPVPRDHGGLDWLVRRAAAVEGATGQGAMSRWQEICQDRLLRRTRPRVVAWPWENHVWERGFVRRARTSGVKTVGYLHIPHGRHHWGISPASNRDGLDDTPDVLVCTGPALLDELRSLGYPAARLCVGGNLRDIAFQPLPHNPEGPVLVALPNIRVIARQMEKAALALRAQGRKVVVKPHPLAPAAAMTLPREMYTKAPLGQQPALSAVVFATSSIGLEALAGGLPVLRFRPAGIIAPIPAIPSGETVPAVDASGLEAALSGLAARKAVDMGRYYAPPAPDVWRRVLGVENLGFGKVAENS